MISLRTLRAISIAFRILCLVICIVVLCIYWPMKWAQMVSIGYLIGTGLLAIVELIRARKRN